MDLATKPDTSEPSRLTVKSHRQGIHCSYHKCLTVYFKRVLTGVCNRCFPWRGRFRHYNSDLTRFAQESGSDRISSLNNRALPRELLTSLQITRFVRDPRDLVVSGYFYHRRGAEAWTRAENPSPSEWEFANGQLPRALISHGGSFAQLLQRLSPEEGLLAELEFRRFHFESMREWPIGADNVLTLRYEDVLRDPEGSFDRVFLHYGFSPLERRLGRWWARRHSLARRQGRDVHVRDPQPGQWRKHFTVEVEAAFDEAFGDLPKLLGYSS